MKTAPTHEKSPRLFEKLKQQFDEATSKDVPELLISNDHEVELEEELQRLRKEQVELNIKLTCSLKALKMHLKCIGKPFKIF